MKKFSTYLLSLSLAAFLIIAGFSGSLQLQAQVPQCIEPTQINSTAVCPLIYAPVCGCDGVTYSNSCFAFNAGVITWTNGECPTVCVEVPECVLKASPAYDAVITADPFCCNNFWDAACQAAYNALNSSCTDTGGCVNPAQINPNAPCPLIYAPVCGCDGLTYANECSAINYAGVTSWTQGECPTIPECYNPAQADPNIFCLDVYQPVCGCDGNTYSNDCYAFYFGLVSSWTQGECPPVDDCVDPNQIDPSVNCVAAYIPVCGCDGITYSNDCVAFYAGGVTSWTEGECPPAGCVDPAQIDPNVLCLDIYIPVCGCDGNTYSNECYATYYGGVTSFTPGVCQPECIDPAQIDPSVLCLDIYLPVCGCDGNTYSNQCQATFYGGVTSFTPGVCPLSNAAPCTGLTGIDFGPCDAFLGYGLVNGQCVAISGCSAVINGVDYSAALSPELSGCQACPCINQEQVDPNAFCTLQYDPVCGCDGNTYSNACFAYTNGITTWTAGECASECIDPAQIDPSVLCLDIYLPVCGCDGNTYSNQCQATFYGGVTSFTPGVCPLSNAAPCTGLTGIDFGPCDAFLGYGLVNGQCVAISGCSAVINGVDYSAALSSELSGCQACPCINQEQVDPNAFCTLQYDPVCGCDGNTYSNACFAYTNGVTTWTAGECIPPCNVLGGTIATNDPRLNLCKGDGYPNFIQFTVTGNTGIGFFGIVKQSNLDVVVANATGLFNIENLPAGQYFAGHISVQNLSQLSGVTNLNQLAGCYSLSNQLAVTSIQLNGGTLTTTNNSSTICSGNLTALVAGNVGPLSRFILLNSNATQVLAQNTTGVFNFTSLPLGTYRIVHISYTNSVNLQAIVPPTLPPCIAASNQVVIQKISCATAMLESSPNPTTGIAWVTFAVATESQATLEVYDMSGRKVTELFRQTAQGGETYRVDFDGTVLPNGVYIYRLTTGSEVLVEKFIIAR